LDVTYLFFSFIFEGSKFNSLPIRQALIGKELKIEFVSEKN